ncbi:hypothetical protein LX36DRAFT_65322 [Colletotrichum falcatum]|nr:hypothetical protein LX36DRAFT_65322 [Colletotrichum falcatum]
MRKPDDHEGCGTVGNGRRRKELGITMSLCRNREGTDDRSWPVVRFLVVFLGCIRTLLLCTWVPAYLRGYVGYCNFALLAPLMPYSFNHTVDGMRANCPSQNSVVLARYGV